MPLEVLEKMGSQVKREKEVLLVTPELKEKEVPLDMLELQVSLDCLDLKVKQVQLESQVTMVHQDLEEHQVQKETGEQLDIVEVKVCTRNISNCGICVSIMLIMIFNLRDMSFINRNINFILGIFCYQLFSYVV